MSEMAEVFDDAPSPWWPCPECGGQEFRTTVMFERGQWTVNDAETVETYEEFDPPEGRPTAVGVSDVECATCCHRFNIHQQYRWPGAEDCE